MSAPSFLSASLGSNIFSNRTANVVDSNLGCDRENDDGVLPQHVQMYSYSRLLLDSHPTRSRTWEAEAAQISIRTRQCQLVACREYTRRPGLLPHKLKQGNSWPPSAVLGLSPSCAVIGVIVVIEGGSLWVRKLIGITWMDAGVRRQQAKDL